MSLNVRIARYTDIHHMEALIQVNLEQPDRDFVLPPVERPHIYNVLNFHISRSEAMVAVVNANGKSKMAGMIVMQREVLPWNSQYIVFSPALIAINPVYQHLDVVAQLLKELVSVAVRNGAPLVIRPTPGLESGITPEIAAKVGLKEEYGVFYLNPAPPMEKAAE